MKKLNLLTAFVFATLAISTNIINATDPKEDKTFIDGIKEGLKDSPKECAKETIKKAYTTLLLDPLVIEPIKNVLYPAEKIQKDTATIITLSEQIKKLKDAGANKKLIAALSAQLTQKIQNLSSKLGAKKGNK